MTFDQSEPIGLYLEVTNGHIAEEKELDEALEVHNAFRARYGKTPLEKAYYTDKSPQRMWAATVTGTWINGTERDEEGLLIKDVRQPVTAAELLSNLE